MTLDGPQMGTMHARRRRAANRQRARDITMLANFKWRKHVAVAFEVLSQHHARPSRSPWLQKGLAPDPLFAIPNSSPQ